MFQRDSRASRGPELLFATGTTLCTPPFCGEIKRSRDLCPGRLGPTVCLSVKFHKLHQEITGTRCSFLTFQGIYLPTGGAVPQHQNGAPLQLRRTWSKGNLLSLRNHGDTSAFQVDPQTANKFSLRALDTICIYTGLELFIGSKVR